MRSWKILEGAYSPRESYRHGGMEDELDEAYECGYSEGFGAAMKRVEEEKYGRMGYRNDNTNRTVRSGSSSSQSYGSRIGYREEEDSEDMMGERMGYRRNRDSRGRYM